MEKWRINVREQIRIQKGRNDENQDEFEGWQA
jgi:hypothetical protein